MSLPATSPNAHGLTFGVRLPNSGPLASTASILSVATEAERLGYDQLWVHDHVSWPQEKLTHYAAGSIEICKDQPSNFYESISTISFLAGRLQRIKVGIAGLVLPLRDPRVIAKQLTAVEQFAEREVTVVIGVGAIQNDFEVMGVPFKRRGRITNDYLGALRAIMTSEFPMGYESDALTFADGTFLPHPQNLTLWIAGSSEAALNRAATFGDGWMTVYNGVDAYAEKARHVRDLVAEKGRDPERFALAYETYVCVEETYEEAVETARASLEYQYDSLERGLDVCLIGSAADVAEKVQRYAAAGVSHFELKFICRSVEHLNEMVGRLAGTLLPLR